MMDKNLVKQAREDLAKRLGVPVGTIEVVRFEAVTWRDGSLGCPKPGVMYTQALVDGSLIELKVGEKIYRYHSGWGRSPFLCDRGSTKDPLPSM